MKPTYESPTAEELYIRLEQTILSVPDGTSERVSDEDLF